MCCNSDAFGPPCLSGFAAPHAPFRRDVLLLHFAAGPILFYRMPRSTLLYELLKSFEAARNDRSSWFVQTLLR